MKNTSNIRKYKILSKFYDSVFSKLLNRGRTKALSLLDFKENQKVLLIGVGTGLDIPLIPEYCHIMGADLSPSMLDVAKRKFKRRDADFKEMNAEVLEFIDAEFDVVILSLILSVVENPKSALEEALRVVKQDGSLLIFDKFREEKVTFGRKLLNVITSAVGTDINRSFDDIVDGFKVIIHEDIPVMYADNYRAILVSKKE